jgi:D-alanyl-D-alanine carboxypeptidase (penicillin-binding protein 5/6)
LSTNRLVAALTVGVLVVAPAAARAVDPVSVAGAEASSRAMRAPPQVTCAACIVVDERGRALWARRPDAARANASTTKIVTALLVVRAAAADEPVAVSATAAATGGGGVDLKAGQVLSVRALLFALLLTSSNDAAVALAEHVAGSEASFVAAMNRFARRSGATATRFVTAHGLDRSGHHASARDLARFADVLLANSLLSDIVATERASIEGPEGPLMLENRNSLLETYRGAIGVKTGFTAGAGDVLVAAARRGGRRLIAVAMGSDDAAGDARALLDAGWERLRRTVLVRRGQHVGRLVFDPGGAVQVLAAATVRGMADPSALEVRFVPSPAARPPLRRGEVVGQAALAAGRRRVATVAAETAGVVAAERGDGVVELLGGVLRIGHALLGSP